MSSTLVHFPIKNICQGRAFIGTMSEDEQIVPRASFEKGRQKLEIAVAVLQFNDQEKMFS
jgi:hypothetical protein